VEERGDRRRPVGGGDRSVAQRARQWLDRRVTPGNDGHLRARTRSAVRAQPGLFAAEPERTTGLAPDQTALERVVGGEGEARGAGDPVDVAEPGARLHRA